MVAPRPIPVALLLAVGAGLIIVLFLSFTTPYATPKTPDNVYYRQTMECRLYARDKLGYTAGYSDDYRLLVDLCMETAVPE